MKITKLLRSDPASKLLFDECMALKKSCKGWDALIKEALEDDHAYKLVEWGNVKLNHHYLFLHTKSLFRKYLKIKLEES